VVDRLHGIYIWWIKELFDGARLDQPERLEVVARQMVALRGGWEQLSATARQAQVRQAAGSPAQAAVSSGFTVEGLVG